MAGNNSTITYDSDMISTTTSVINDAIQGAYTEDRNYPAWNVDDGWSVDILADTSAAGVLDPSATKSYSTDDVLDHDVHLTDKDSNPVTSKFTKSYSQLLYSRYMAQKTVVDQLAQTADNLTLMAQVYQKTENATRSSIFDTTLPLSSRGS